MKKFFLLLFVMTLPLLSHAQFKFGYFSYDKALRSMPEYAVADANMKDLRRKYEAEMKRVEEEFNRKYEEFLDGQRDFAPTILQKRQTELQELLKKNVAFKAESEKLLQQAETEAFAPLREKLAKVVQQVGADRGYAFIINTDGDACPFINPEMGEDVLQIITEALQ